MVGDRVSPLQRTSSPPRRPANRRLSHFLALSPPAAPPGPIGPATSRLKPPSILSNVSRLLYARINRRDSSFAIKSRYVRISKRRARKSRLVKTLLYALLLSLSHPIRPSPRSGELFLRTIDRFYRAPFSTRNVSRDFRSSTRAFTRRSSAMNGNSGGMELYRH